MAITTEQSNKVLELYSAYFNRAADASGFTFWKNSFQSYSDNAPASVTTAADKEVYALQKIVSDMSTATEYKALYPSTQSSTDFVNAIYTNLLNRASDAEGLTFWSGHIDAKTMTKEEAILKMIEGAKANTTDQGKLDALLIANKNTVAKYFAETLKSDDLALAKGAFAGLTSDSATVTTAQAALDSAVNAGEIIALTTAVDVGGSFIGTDKNETFVGTSSSTNPTINLGDSIDGGAGTDTLKIATSLTSAIPSIITKNIEDYVITNSGAGGSLAVSTQSTAPTTVTFLAGSNVGFSLSGIKTTTSVALESESGQITLAFDNVAGTTDAVSLALNDAKSTASVNVGAGVETVNLNTTGAASTLASLTGANVNKLVITGNQDLSITTALANTITTVDASAATAKVSLSIATGGDVTLTGGSGDDTFMVAGLNGNDTINGGAGKDMLSVATDIANAADVAKVSNIETLEFTAATTQDLSLLNATGIKTFKFSDATNNAAYTKNENAFSHIMSEKTAGDFSATVASDTNADVLNIELKNSDLGTLTATNYETVNLTSSVGAGAGTVTNTVTTLTNSAASKIVITGDTNLTITNALAAQGTVDASALTGKLTVTGSGAADTLIGGTNNDMLTGGNGVDTFTGNAGDDKFVVITAAANDVDTTLGAITDIVTDFTTGTNTLSGLGTAASASNYFEETNSAANLNLTALLTAADTKLDGTIKYYLDSFGGDTYVVVDDNGTGYTDVIKLMGTTLDNIDTSNIIA